MHPIAQAEGVAAEEAAEAALLTAAAELGHYDAGRKAVRLER